MPWSAMTPATYSPDPSTPPPPPPQISHTFSLLTPIFQPLHFVCTHRRQRNCKKKKDQKDACSVIVFLFTINKVEMIQNTY